ncbi:MAG: DUF423 domain-containing protein [Elusimicrobia bacterium]|nr:DUF423 domain-containing protein [Elusimicrobiota bacterium]
MFAAVALGAFAAHGLKARLSPEMLAVFETGVRYQAYHALGLIAAAWLMERWPGRLPSAAGSCFLAGILLFSGSLYLLSLTGARKLGIVTPFGGVLFLVGWALLAASPRP